MSRTFYQSVFSHVRSLSSLRYIFTVLKIRTFVLVLTFVILLISSKQWSILANSS